MNRKFASVVSVFAGLTIISGIAWGLATRTQSAPVIFTTVPKVVIGQFQSGDGSHFPVPGRASLTVTAANENDTLTGTLVYAIPDDARQKIARSLGKAPAEIPSNVLVKSVTANFRPGTACPVMRVEVLTKEIDLAGAKLNFDRIELDIHETPNQLTQLFCSWTRQINAKRQRNGIIAAINRLIRVED